MKLCSRFLLVLLVVFSTSCAFDEDPGFRIIAYTFDFSTSTHGWVPGFADYPAGPDDSTFYELKFDHITRPNSTKKAIFLSGNNHSDDLFMYIKTQLVNLDPNTEYTITFDVEFASDAKKGSVGAGGSPGESVFMKVGASATEPKSVIENENYVLNIDKGNQAQAGDDMVVIGDIAGPADSEGYVLLNRSNGPYSNNNYQTPVVATTNSNGELWLIIGTDSGFEGVTNLYYATLNIVLSKDN
jgi:hypothetical protein